MRYHVLATDYDGTLAQDGVVAEPTIDALRRLGRSGRRLVLVTGRELGDLKTVFPQLELFDLVVAENGALLYDARSRAERPLADAPDPRFVAALRERGVEPLSVGRVIVATWEPHERDVLEEIKKLGLELEVIFNKGSVMVLPAGVTKASGFHAALDELGLSAHNAVGVGDAENDHAFLAECEAAVAVANALPALKERADLVTRGARGEGVVELIERILADDLRSLEPALGRHAVALGRVLGPDGRESRELLEIQPYGSNVLVAGPSGGGKSMLTTGLLERLGAAGYQFCVVDPEGDHEEFEGGVILGDAGRPPSIDEALRILAAPGRSVILNLLGVRLQDRPGFCQAMLPRLDELRARTGRPHWLVIDEAHHLLPADWQPAPEQLPRALESTLLVTVHPGRVAPAVLDSVNLVLAVGERPSDTLHEFVDALARPRPVADAHAGAGDRSRPNVPTGLPERLAPEQALAWRPEDGETTLYRVAPASSERGRHRRKYAAGALPPDRSFYFRGPDGRLNLRAQNLELFLQLAEGVDDETWRYHLERGDYSSWMRETVKDEDLVRDVAAVERRGGAPAETRSAIRDVVERRYTAPA